MTPTIAAAALLQIGTVLCPTASVTDLDAPASPLPPSQTTDNPAEDET
jgi:hypothetical protein